MTGILFSHSPLYGSVKKGENHLLDIYNSRRSDDDSKYFYDESPLFYRGI